MFTFIPMFKIRTRLTACLVLTLAFCAAAYAQSAKVVSGTVKDQNGDPLIGVNVLESGTTNGTMTDPDGQYTIKLTTSSPELVFSSIGYKTETIRTGNRSTINLTMQDDEAFIEEVVVIGYGTARKKDLTGSVVQIKPDKMANENPGTVQDLLRGTPGLNVGYRADAKGGGSLQIRGQRSVYTGGNHNAPLIILDGMAFYGEISEINPDDIGQIDILKDASAAAVYGAKAANGVIIISTKRGKKGKPTINVSINTAANTKSDYLMDVYDAEGYVRYRQDWYLKDTYGMDESGTYRAYGAKAYKNKQGYFHTMEQARALYGVDASVWEGYTTNEAGESAMSIYGKRLGMRDEVLENYLAGKTFDWWGHTFRTGFNQDYNASISGASDNLNYYLSGGYLRNEGVVKGNEYRAVRANMKLNGKVTDWLEVGANVNFQDRSDGDISVGLGTNFWDANQLRNAPYSNYRKADGELEQYPMSVAQKWGYNFDFERQYMDLEKGYQVLNTIFNAKVTLPFNITWSFNAAPRYQYRYNRYFTSAARPDSAPSDRGVDRGWSKRFEWSLNNTITWDYTFARKHHVILTLVQEAEERRYWSDNISAREILPSDALGFHNTQNATKEKSSFSTSDSHQTADALLARLFYSYDDRYLFTASIRRDGYSAFGSSNPYATFPSVAVAWNVVNEDFWKWHDIVNTLKVRLSWGKNGNRSLSDPYVSLANLSSGTGATMGYIKSDGSVLDMKYLGVDRMANPNLQWEKTTATNFGLDFGFLNDRISGTFDYYHMETHDMIMSQRLPGFTGFGSITTNLGQVDNDGFELSLNSVNIRNKNFEWRTDLGLSYNKNTIKHLYYNYDENGREQDDKSNGWFIDKPIGTIWSYKVEGIWQIDEYEEAARYKQRPGDPKVWNNPANDEYNEDGTVKKIVYNNDDKVFLGQNTPKVRLSLRNEFDIMKNLSVSFSLYSYLGHKSLSGWYLNEDNAGSLITYCYNTWVKGYWTPENPTNDYARLDAIGPAGATGARKLYNRSFVRFNDFAVAYTFPKRWFGRTGIQKLKAYFNIKNVGAWAADWEYGDPETGGLATRTFTFGVNITL